VALTGSGMVRLPSGSSAPRDVPARAGSYGDNSNEPSMSQGHTVLLPDVSLGLSLDRGH